jgi:ABC-type lipoprotein export system ATPase subunit
MLRAKGLYKSYTMGRVKVKVLRGASLLTEKGGFLAVMGASGSGKSTLLHLLGALDMPDRGNVEFSGRSLFELSASEREVYRNRDVGFVFQFYHLLPELNVLENVLITRLITHSWWSWQTARRQARRDAEEILERVGLTERIKHRSNELSGGERQRVAIARALVNRPALLLADEPTGNLDETIGGEILSLLVELNDAGQTIVMVTHDAKIASRAHRCVQLSDGVIRETGGNVGRRASGPVAAKEVAP